MFDSLRVVYKQLVGFFDSAILWCFKNMTSLFLHILYDLRYFHPVLLRYNTTYLDWGDMQGIYHWLIHICHLSHVMLLYVLSRVFSIREEDWLEMITFEALQTISFTIFLNKSIYWSPLVLNMSIIWKRLLMSLCVKYRDWMICQCVCVCLCMLDCMRPCTCMCAYLRLCVKCIVCACVCVF